MNANYKFHAEDLAQFGSSFARSKFGGKLLRNNKVREIRGRRRDKKKKRKKGKTRWLTWNRGASSYRSVACVSSLARRKQQHREFNSRNQLPPRLMKSHHRSTSTHHQQQEQEKKNQQVKNTRKHSITRGSGHRVAMTTPVAKHPRTAPDSLGHRSVPPKRITGT